MRGATLLLPVLFALEVFATGRPAGELLPKLSPKIKKSLLTDRDLGLFIPTHKSTPGLTPGFTPRRYGLNTRQLTCGDPTFSICPGEELCCPIGGLCCPGATCCDRGFKCCPGGDCCPNTHTCVIVDRRQGCCPLGKTCSTDSTTCADEGFLLCPNENFCCQPGDTCWRDERGNPKCGGDPILASRTTSVVWTLANPTTITTTRAQDPEVTRTRDDNDDASTTSVIEEDDEDEDEDFTTTARGEQTVSRGGVPTTMNALTTPSSASTAIRSPSSRSVASAASSSSNTSAFSVNGAASFKRLTEGTLTALIIGVVGTFVLV